jgi:phage I-like protein
MTTTSDSHRGSEMKSAVFPGSPTSHVTRGDPHGGRHLAVLLSGPGTLEASGLREVPVAVTGSWVKDSKRFTITLEDLRDMVRNFAKRKNEQLVIDFEHASEQPAIAKGGPIPAAGWIHALRLAELEEAPRASNNGHNRPAPPHYLMALVEWTPQAEEMIRNGQYRFFSPAIDWNARDKQTGAPQGATLTSGALTNHPFLEELPPIMLTDADAPSAPCLLSSAIGMEGALADARLGEAKMKRLSLRKLTEGEHAGHVGVFEGEELQGVVPKQEFEDLAREHLGINPDAVRTAAEQEELTALLSELGIESSNRGSVSSTGIAELRRRLAAASAAEQNASAAAGRMVLLRDAVRNGYLDNVCAVELARQRKITLDDYIAAQEAERALDRAVQAGKILPRDRGFFFRDALERPEEFARFVGNAAPVVPLGSRGIGSTEQIPIDQEVDLGARRLMSERNLTYGKALKVLFRENPGLEERYRRAHSKEVSATAEGTLGSGITQ